MKDAKRHAERLKDLMSALVDFAQIDRQIYFPDRKYLDRQENDSEHSFNLAMCAWYLSAYLPGLNQEKVLKMALAHDLVELHAGDVMAIGRTEKQAKEKKQKEAEALEKLKQEWPDFSGLTKSIEEYELKASKEALFVYSLDKILPMHLNLLSEGKTWKMYNIERNIVVKNKDSTTQRSPEISAIWQELRKEILSKNDYFNEGKAS